MLAPDTPMSKRQVKVLVIALGASLVFGAVLFGGYIPGLKANLSAPSYATFDGRQFYVEVVPLHPPGLSSTSPPWNVSYRGVVFNLSIGNWYSLAGGVVHGNGTEANGTTFGFALGERDANGSRVTTFVSPDAVFAAFYPGGGVLSLSMELGVAVSYLDVESPAAV